MTAMLGIKLDEALDRRIANFAKAKGQAKSEIGRRALVEYLDRHALDEEFRRQLAAASTEDVGDLASLSSAAFEDSEWTW